MKTIELTKEELEVLKDILGIELYDHLNDKQIEVWQQMATKIFKIK